MRNTIILPSVAVVTVAILVTGIAATTVNGVNTAYANKGDDKIKQTKVLGLNKCANVGDNNKRIDIERVRCEINHDPIFSVVSFPLLQERMR
jgi:hypothetical protein